MRYLIPFLLGLHCLPYGKFGSGLADVPVFILPAPSPLHRFG